MRLSAGKLKKLPKVGGLTNPNFEIILRLKPDLVILLKEHSSLFDFLSKNKIEYLCIDDQNVSSILASFKIIGEKCGRQKKADSLVQLIKNEMTQDQIKPPWPRALICVDRENRVHGKITLIYVAGKKSFYNELLNAACLNNVLGDTKITYPELSSEGIIRMQPETVVDFTIGSQRISESRMKSDRFSLAMVPAVKNNRYFAFQTIMQLFQGPVY